MLWEQTKEWMIQNIRLLTAIVGAFVVVLGAAAGVVEFFKWQEKRAVETLYQAREAFAALSPTDRPSQGPAIFRKVIETHGRSRAAFEAAVSIGDIHADAKNFAEAAKGFAEAVALAPDDFAKALAVYNEGVALELAGNCEQAVVKFAAVEKISAGKFLVPEVLMAQGRCFESKQEYARAAEIYQRIQSEFPTNAYFTGAAQVFLDKLKPQLKN